MKEQEQPDIALMDWSRFEESLLSTARSTALPEGIPTEASLQEYFGNEEYDYLRKLADHAESSRSRGPAVGNVVFVPGIMGSDLISVDKKGKKEIVWLSLFRLVTGQFKRLKLSEDGKSSADPNFAIQPGELNKRTYARAILWLRASWNVEPFAYDWRKDIDSSADALADFIHSRFPDQPVNLVAHSMGGLVSRNFIMRHREQWKAMQEKDGKQGGRLVMLGTPNYGSFAIPQAMTGQDSTIKLLAAVDFKNNISEIVEIINTFVGSYQMLPSPSKLSPAQQTLYRAVSWKNAAVSDQHLNRAMQFHTDLEQQDAGDLERMVYIAGCNKETPFSLKINAPGDFDYRVTPEGDGSVPHSLGILPEVPTWYVDESHGDLPRNELVLSAVNDLLTCGRTSVLSDKPIVSRTIVQSGYQRRNLIQEQNISEEVRETALRVKNNEAAPEEIRLVEETIMRSVMGQSLPSRVQPPRKKKSKPKKTMNLAVEIVQGDVTQIEAPVVVIGHYKGVEPVNAEGAIDKALDSWITLANHQGIIGADLGELFFIPVTGNRIAAKTVLLAGMGEEGRFSRDDLRYLMTNVTLSVSALKLESFATVIIGSGAGNLSKERAVLGIIEGVNDALQRLSEEQRIGKLMLINFERDSAIQEALKHIEDENVFPDLKLTCSESVLPLLKTAAPTENASETASDNSPNVLQGGRITIERNQETFRFSALSNSAVIPVREVEVQSYFANGTAERLITSESLEEQEKFGQLLATYLFPQDFRKLIEEEDALTLILDRSTASFPWEMACFKSARGNTFTTFLGPDRMLTRQFRTILSSPGLMPRLNRSLTVLVIADPAPEQEYQLSGARQEGRMVVNVLNRFRKELDITIHERIGSSACDPVEILALLLNEEIDIVHYAGHGFFDEKDPAHSGWVFGKECILSAREIFRARRVPRLVFANACFSSVIKDRPAMTPDEGNRRLAGLAEAFFERGIQNYIGAGWAVADGPAEKFAEGFYKRALTGESLGTSLAEARKSIIDEGSTWGAYQHYGQVNARLVTEKKSGRK